MAEIIVRNREKDYPVYIASGIASEAGGIISRIGGVRRLMLISDSKIPEEKVSGILKNIYRSGIKTAQMQIIVSQNSGNLELLNRIYRALFMSDIGKQDLILALGGLSVINIAGFSAATYLRGIKLINMPTTLAAQAGGAVSGKNSIKLGYAQSIAGTFHIPHAVITDPGFLSSLPREEFSCGMAEILNTAACSDPDLFSQVERKNRDTEWLIMRTISERLPYLRTKEGEDTNGFGRLFAKAIESAGAYTLYRYGEALSIAMVYCCELGEKSGVTEKGTAERLKCALRGEGLPVLDNTIGCDGIYREIESMVRSEKLRLKIPERIGSAKQITLHVDAIKNFLREKEAES